MEALKALQSLGLGSEVAGPGGEQLLQQAQQVWSMLDDMADKDPQAYRRFMDKQSKEQQELTAPPQPHMCVRTRFQVSELDPGVRRVSFSHSLTCSRRTQHPKA